MNWIKTIKIENFQSHKDTLITLVKGVNIFTGSTDSGKSAIIRALYWLLFNSPSGNGMRSTWGGATKVTVNFADGTIVSRIKDPENKYVLNGVVEFKATGTYVPDEIQEALNLTKVNFQQQLDSHFLLANEWTPGKVAAHFNKIAGFDTIDIVTSNIKSDITKTNRGVAYDEEQIKEKEKESVLYNYLNEVESKLVKLESYETKVNKLNADIESITITLDEIEIINDTISIYQKLSSLEKQVTDIFFMFAEEKRITSEIDELENLLLDLGIIETKLANYAKIAKLETKVNDILELHESTSVLTNEISILETFSTTISILTETIAKTKQKRIEMQATFDENMEVCPLCNTKLR